MEPTQTQPVEAPAPAPVKKPSYGALIAILIILAGVVVGALYFWGERVQKDPNHKDEAALDALDAQSTSTEAAAIEADLQAETPDEFEKDFDQAFVELDGALGE